MADKRKQIGAEVDPDVWQAFREDVKDRRGSVRGKLGEEVDRALRAYINASHGGDLSDRVTRLEGQLDHVVELLEKQTEKKQNSDVSATVENRLEKIRESIETTSDGAPRVHEDVVEMAIKKHAGKSDPTLRQYKKLLQEERDLFPDPRGAYYFRDADRFAAAVNTMAEDGDITSSEYSELVDETYGREWWEEQLRRFEERTQSDGGRAFQ